MRKRGWSDGEVEEMAESRQTGIWLEVDLSTRGNRKTDTEVENGLRKTLLGRLNVKHHSSCTTI